jgi:hypothetical protein
MIESRSMALPGVSVLSRVPFFGRGKLLDQRFVDPLDPVVASLVVTVDGPFDGSDARVLDIGTPRDIFFVPQQKVELMLLADRL